MKLFAIVREGRKVWKVYRHGSYIWTSWKGWSRSTGMLLAGPKGKLPD